MGRRARQLLTTSSRKEPYEHLLQGRGSWVLGLSGFIIRVRGLVTAVFCSLLGGGVFAYVTFIEGLWSYTLTVRATLVRHHN